MTEDALLRVADLTAGRAPTVDSDPYIPLQIRWAAPALRQGPPPVYVRVSGLAGGELEFRIDRLSGELLVLTVLSLGAMALEPPLLYPTVTPEPICGLVMDTTPWEGDENVVDVELLLRPYRLPDGLRVDIVGVDTRRLLNCGPRLTLGIDVDGALASLSASLDIEEHHFR
jgi:hypothetical protein